MGNIWDSNVTVGRNHVQHTTEVPQSNSTGIANTIKYYYYDHKENKPADMINLH